MAPFLEGLSLWVRREWAKLLALTSWRISKRKNLCGPPSGYILPKPCSSVILQGRRAPRSCISAKRRCSQLWGGDSASCVLTSSAATLALLRLVHSGKDETGNTGWYFTHRVHNRASDQTSFHMLERLELSPHCWRSPACMKSCTPQTGVVLHATASAPFIGFFLSCRLWEKISFQKK